MLEYLLISFGITFIVVYSKLFRPLRNWLKTPILECALCFGFWAGWFVLLCSGLPIATHWMWPFAASGTSYLLSNLGLLLEGTYKNE